MSGLTNLIQMGLYHNQVSGIAPLATLTDLMAIDLRDNRVTNISALSELTGLRTGLLLDDNQITGIRALSALTELTYLDVRDNHVPHLSGVEDMTNLIWLRPDNNQITDLAPLLTNAAQGGAGIRQLRLLAEQFPNRVCPDKPDPNPDEPIRRDRILAVETSAGTGHTEKQLSASVSRHPHLLRDHRLIRKLPNRRRYRLTAEGRQLTTALNALLPGSLPQNGGTLRH